MGAYLDVFIESILANSIIPFMHEPSFFAMHSFGGYNMPLAAVLAILGSFIGAAFNFALGLGLLRLYRRKNDRKHLPIDKYNKFKHTFSRYFIILLPLSWMPLLNILVLLAGFFGTKARLVLSLVLAGQIAHYGWYLFN